MSNLKTDRNQSYMKEMWGTTTLITDYGSLRFLDKPKKHNLKTQNQLHETIRNDDDYDDWEYGTEPTYGNPWY